MNGFWCLMLFFMVSNIKASWTPETLVKKIGLSSPMRG